MNPEHALDRFEPEPQLAIDTARHRPLIVGLCGYARSGKDEVIKAICDAWPGEVLVDQWAFGVKRRAVEAFPHLTWGDVQGDETDRDTPRDDLNGKTVRQLLIGIGQLAREFDPDYWVKDCMNRIHDSFLWSRFDIPRLVLISGTGFENEAQACDEVWWVDRPGTERGGDSRVLTPDRGYHYTIYNDSDLSTLHARAVLCAAKRLTLWERRGQA